MFERRVATRAARPLPQQRRRDCVGRIGLDVNRDRIGPNAGRQGEVVLGKKSGKLSITYNLEKLGVKDATDEAIGEMLKRVKDLGIEKRGLLTDDEFREIADSVLAAKR